MSRVNRTPTTPPTIRPGTVASAGLPFLPALLAQPSNAWTPAPAPDPPDLAPPAAPPASMAGAPPPTPPAFPADCWEGLPCSWALGLQAGPRTPVATTPALAPVPATGSQDVRSDQTGAGPEAPAAVPSVPGHPLPVPLPTQAADESVATAVLVAPVLPLGWPDAAQAPTVLSPTPLPVPPIELWPGSSLGTPAATGPAPEPVPPALPLPPWQQPLVPAHALPALGSAVALAAARMPSAAAQVQGALVTGEGPSLSPEIGAPGRAAATASSRAWPAGPRSTSAVPAPPGPLRALASHTVADGRLRVVHDLTAWAHGWLDQLADAASDPWQSAPDSAPALGLASAATASWQQPTATFALAAVLQPATAAASWLPGSEATPGMRGARLHGRAHSAERDAAAGAPAAAEAVPLAPRLVLLAVNEDGHCTAYVRDYQSAEPLIERLVEQLRRFTVSDGRTLLRIVVNGRAYHDYEQSRGDQNAG